MRPTRSPRVITLAALGLALLASPLVALASHQYSDVPNSNPFHGDIAAITNAGVTSGCGGNEFCPNRTLTRAEMAAFMNRLGALAPNKTPVVNADKLDGLTSSQFARTDQTQHFNCSGSDMSPSTGGGGPGNAWYAGSGSLDITCAVHLPDGATVTSFSALVTDSSASYQNICYLFRIDTVGTPGYLSTLTSGFAAAPGRTTLVDNTIDFPVIDNVAYTYTADCTLYGGAQEAITVHRVTMTYTGAP